MSLEFRCGWSLLLRYDDEVERTIEKLGKKKSVNINFFGRTFFHRL